MSFVRAKEIPPRSGNWYDYEVETVHEEECLSKVYSLKDILMGVRQ